MLHHKVLPPTASHAGPLARDLAKLVPDARSGVDKCDALDETFIPPLPMPRLPARMYYFLRAPIKLEPSMAKDRQACEEVYAQIRGQVEGGLTYLLHMRGADPWGALVPRYLYEHPPLGGRPRRAPSFPVAQLDEFEGVTGI